MSFLNDVFVEEGVAILGAEDVVRVKTVVGGGHVLGIISQAKDNFLRPAGSGFLDELSRGLCS